MREKLSDNISIITRKIDAANSYRQLRKERSLQIMTEVGKKTKKPRYYRKLIAKHCPQRKSPFLFLKLSSNTKVTKIIGYFLRTVNIYSLSICFFYGLNAMAKP